MSDKGKSKKSGDRKGRDNGGEKSRLCKFVENSNEVARVCKPSEARLKNIKKSKISPKR